jgi:hypothetical protein
MGLNLVGFGHKNTLEWERFILSEFIQQPDKPLIDANAR